MTNLMSCPCGNPRVKIRRPVAKEQVMALVTREVSYRCSDDCIMSGCPGHTGILAYHSVSDHYVFNMNGETYALERGELEAMILLLRSLNRADAVDLDEPQLNPLTQGAVNEHR